jgi:hypothetical protein
MKLRTLMLLTVWCCHALQAASSSLHDGSALPNKRSYLTRSADTWYYITIDIYIKQEGIAKTNDSVDVNEFEFHSQSM